MLGARKSPFFIGIQASARKLQRTKQPGSLMKLRPLTRSVSAGFMPNHWLTPVVGVLRCPPNPQSLIPDSPLSFNLSTCCHKLLGRKPYLANRWREPAAQDGHQSRIPTA